MEDVNISKYRAQVVRAGSTPASPGFVVSEGQNPVDPSGSGQNHLPVTIATAATGLSITESQVLGGAGTVGQYIRGDGSLADFPATTGGGSSVSYYLNGSVSQGTIGGVAYKELNRTPVFGAGTDISINADGYIASFITDALDPNKLLIPGGNWNFETYFSASSSGGSPSFYVELYKYDGTTFTLLATSSSSPELIAFGTNLNPYFSTLAVPETVLALTDRLAVRFYVTHSGRTITLHTEDNHLCQVITTFTTGLTALNGLTSQVQFFAVGTSGTDFAISSASDTHTFNLPTATSTIRGALSSADWSTFNGKQNALTNPVTGTGTTNYLPKFTGASTIGDSNIFNSGTSVGINTATPGSYGLAVDYSGAAFSVISIKNTSSAGYSGVHLLNNSGTVMGHIGYANASTGAYLQDVIFIGSIASKSVVFTTADTIKMALFANGNLGLGVGTTDAGYKLDVNGTGRFSGSALTPVTLTLTSANSNCDITMQSANSSSVSKIRNGTNDLQFHTNGTLALTLASNQAATFSSNQNATSTYTIQNTDITNTNSRLRLDLVGGNSALSFVSIHNDHNYISSVSGKDLYFQQSFGGTTNLTIKSNGNLLVGTTTDNGARFQVSGRAYINNVGGSVAGTTIYGNDQANVRLRLENVSGRTWELTGGLTGANNSDFTIYDVTASATRLAINSSGNVGIGTTSPASRLQIEGTGTGAWLTINRTDSGTNIVDFTQSGGRLGYVGYVVNDLYINNATASNTLLLTSGAERMRITSVGRGLFGTTTASAGAGGFGSNSFQVNNEVVSMGSLAGLFWENRSGGVTNNSNWYGWYTTGGTIYLYNGAANAASINPSTGAYTALSDANKKKDFENSTIGLNAILGLKPTLYRMKSESNTEKHLGFIAQEVKEYIPQAYVQTEDFIGLNYNSIIPVLVNAIKELNDKIK